jgi:hypothetical protein
VTAEHVLYKYINANDRYVKDPLLIEGFKITFRIYAALTSLDPTVVYVYPGGLGRICSEKYVMGDGYTVIMLY